MIRLSLSVYIFIIICCRMFSSVTRFLFYFLVYSPKLFLIQISGPRANRSQVKLPSWWRN